MPPETQAELASATRLAGGGDAVARRGRHAEAEPLYQQALAIRRASWARTTPTPPPATTTWPPTCDAQGKYAEAEPLLPQGPGDPPQGAGRGPPRHRQQLQQPGLLTSQAQGKYAEAEPLYRKALAIRRKVLGEDHPDTATSYNNLAVQPAGPGQVRRGRAAVPQGPGDPPQGAGRGPPRHRHQLQQPGLLPAMPRASTPRPSRCYRKALAIRRKALGEDHPDTATSYNNLAVNLNAQGKYAEAEPLLPQGPGDPPQGAGRGPPRHRHQLQQPGRATWTTRASTPRPSRCSSKALAIRRKVLGEDHPDTAASYNNLACNLDAQGKYAEAEPLYQQGPGDPAARCWARTTPTPPTATTTWPCNLQCQGKYAEAEPLLPQGPGHPPQGAGRGPPRHRHQLQQPGRLACRPRASTPRPCRCSARPWRSAARCWARTTPTPPPATTTWPSTWTPRASTPRPSRCYRKALAIRRKALGEDHPDTAPSYNNLAV